jgi:hypothetical protein
MLCRQLSFRPNLQRPPTTSTSRLSAYGGVEPEPEPEPEIACALVPGSPYKYDPLPRGKWFGLLELLTGAYEDDLHCNLKAFKLTRLLLTKQSPMLREIRQLEDQSTSKGDPFKSLPIFLMAFTASETAPPLDICEQTLVELISPTQQNVDTRPTSWAKFSGQLQVR